ncbi:hypothetical protein ACO2I3_15625 [Leptospira interrogans]
MYFTHQNDMAASEDRAANDLWFSIASGMSVSSLIGIDEVRLATNVGLLRRCPGDWRPALGLAVLLAEDYDIRSIRVGSATLPETCGQLVNLRRLLREVNINLLVNQIPETAPLERALVVSAGKAA